MNLEEMKQAVVDALEDIKATDISVLDVSKLTSMASYMIIASGSSNRQTKALADNVKVKLKENTASKASRKGSGCWSIWATSSSTSCCRPRAITTTWSNCGARRKAGASRQKLLPE
jgi:ribosome silencing factor RsfS/YbeB/iojap